MHYNIMSFFIIKLKITQYKIKTLNLKI